jgi:hypothetical protein
MAEEQAQFQAIVVQVELAALGPARLAGDQRLADLDDVHVYSPCLTLPAVYGVASLELL